MAVEIDHFVEGNATCWSDACEKKREQQLEMKLACRRVRSAHVREAPKAPTKGQGGASEATPHITYSKKR